MSARLRDALLGLYRERFQPGPQVFVLGGVDPANFAKRNWRRILMGADLSGITPKDLRDTFASQLLTCGVQLGYVSRQLGHADVAITARHYARWCGDDSYREPMALRAGEHPADFLARLVPESPHKSPQLGNQPKIHFPDPIKKTAQVYETRAVSSGSGGGIRTPDLRVMSPTSYQTALPRNKAERR